jgi:enediyne biosynthesis protein E3
MEQLLKFLNALKMLGRRVGKPSLILEDRKRSREMVRRVFRLWLDGYNAGLEMPPERLLSQLRASNVSDSRGMFDGAFAGVASLYLTSGADASSIEQLVESFPEQAITVALGIGAAISHLGIDAPFNSRMVKQHSGWMCIDSYGLHEGYFHWPDIILKAQIPEGVCPEARRPFDQGLGRGLWAAGEAHPALISDLLSHFSQDRLPDLWQGLGLMIGYWGSYDATDLKLFLRYAGANRASLQLGVALATLLRKDTNDVVDHTEGACNIICQASSGEVATMLRDSLNVLNNLEIEIDQGLFDQDRWHFIIKHTFTRN